MAHKETYEEKQTASNQTAWMAKFWKDSYFQGLDAAVKTQEEAEQAIQDAISQGFAIQRDCLKWSKECAESWNAAGSTVAGMPNPMAVLTRQIADAGNRGTESALKVTEETVKSGFALYEKAIATPMRRQVKDLSARVFETVIPD